MIDSHAEGGQSSIKIVISVLLHLFGRVLGLDGSRSNGSLARRVFKVHFAKDTVIHVISQASNCIVVVIAAKSTFKEDMTTSRLFVVCEHKTNILSCKR